MSLKKKIVFLDIDGVLNNAPHLMRQTDASKALNAVPEDLMPDFRCKEISPELVKNLNALHERTGCVYVLSSSWRHSCSTKQMHRILEYHGWTGEFIGRTAVGHELKRKRRGRGDEIQEWIDDHAGLIEDFVILDDSADMYELLWKLVRTDFEEGLTPIHVERAVKVLDGDADAGESTEWGRKTPSGLYVP